ncbi:MAG: histone deacetylase [Planctomycetaceae bacterium]
MLLFQDDLFEQHDTGQHPEHAGRLKAIRKQLAESGVSARCEQGAIREVTNAELTAIHPTAHVELVQRTANSGGGRLDANTVCSPHSYDVARAAAGVACAAVDAVCTGTSQFAMGLVRPPGHHALQSKAMGFCLFNNIAVAAAHALTQHELNHVLIVDWDVHHGNGTEAIFYDREDVTFFSIHRYPFYPGTGAKSDTGTGAGLGSTFNVPVKFGTSRSDYLDAFQHALEAAAEQCKPQLVLLSAGFDAHRLDPIGSLGLETEDFADLTLRVVDVANTHCQGRLVSLLEGGYNVDALADSVQLHIETLLECEK